MKKIEITCEAAATIPLDEIEILQGNLKELSKENYEKLKSRILQRGFSFPLFIWKDKGTNWLLDGTHRKLVLTKLKEEGYEIPPLPVAFIEAGDLREAKSKILEVSSSYAKFTVEGLEEFAVDLDMEEVAPMLELPDFDINKFMFPINELDSVDDGEDRGAQESSGWSIEVQFPNEMEMRDIHDDLSSRGYMVKVKGE